MEGWAGKILDIDLSSGAVRTIPLDMEIARLYLGGTRPGRPSAMDLVGPEVDPFAPETC